MNGAQAAIGELTDLAVSGEYSNYAVAYAKNRHDGMGEEDARKAAAKSELIDTVVNGVVMGGITDMFAQKLAEMTGTTITYGELSNPYANAEISGSEIRISGTADEPVAELLRHEAAHRIQALAPEQYGEYSGKLSNADFDNAVSAVKERYKSIGQEIQDSIAQGEVSADIARNFPKTKNALERIQRMAEGNPTLIDTMYNAVKDLRAKVKALGGSVYVDQTTGIRYTYDELRQAEKLYETAMAEAVRNNRRNGATDNTEAMYSIRTDSDGRLYVNIDEDILDGVPESEWFRTTKNVMRKKFGGGIDYNGETIAVSGKSRTEFTSSNYTKNLMLDKRADKFRMANYLDEIINTQSDVKSELPNHARKDDIIGFDRGKTTIKVGEREFIADTLLARKEDGTKQFYDILI